MVPGLLKELAKPQARRSPVRGPFQLLPGSLRARPDARNGGGVNRSRLEHCGIVKFRLQLRRMKSNLIHVEIENWQEKLLKWVNDNHPALAERLLKENSGKPVLPQTTLARTKAGTSKR
jgi:hypothetical protein